MSRIARARGLKLWEPPSGPASALVTYEHLCLRGHAVVDYPAIDVQLDRTFSTDGKRRAKGYTSQAAGLCRKAASPWKGVSPWAA
jgi:hypothetical protein